MKKSTLTLLALTSVVTSASALIDLPRASAQSSAQSPVQSPVQPQTPPAQAPATAPAALGPIATTIRSLLESGTEFTIGTTKINGATLKKLYALRNFRPYWTTNSGVTTLGLSAQDMLENESEYHGFNGKHYFTADAEARLQATEATRLAEMDILLSNGYVMLANNMASGRINPKDRSQNLADIELSPQPPPKLEYINNAIKDVESMQQGIRNLAPFTLAYVKLLQTLVALKNAQSWGGWPALKDRTVIRPGMSHENVFGIRVRLVDMGALPKEQRKNRSSVYDDDMVRGVMRLQKATFKAQDGIIGNDTYNILLVPLEKRIVQTKANLERWRLLPRNLGERFLFVDLGRQELDIMEGNNLIGRMKVVVGKDLNGTPTMIDSIRRIIVNPYWRAPKSIVVKEMIPAYQSDRSYFRRNRIRILSSRGEVDPATIDWSRYSMQSPPPYEFRQDPGEENSLGVLKFTLNNAHAIYMHDTNHKEAFNRSIRYLSHGCIRLEKPLALASYLLADQGYDQYQIQDEIELGGIEKSLSLTKSMRVYIFGTTMVAYSDGTVAFGEDVYKQDQRIVDAMNGIHSRDPVVQPTSTAQEQATVQVTPAAQ